MTDKQPDSTGDALEHTQHSKAGSTKPARKKRGGLSLVGEAELPEIEEIRRPSFAVYEGPTIVEGKTCRAGTWYHGIKQNGVDEKGIPLDYWICAPLHVDAETIDSDDGSIGRLLRFAYRGRRIEWVMPMEELAGKGDELLRALLRQGLHVDYRLRRYVPEYVASFYDLRRTIATTRKPGWHVSGAFVLPHRIIGGDGVRYQESGRGAEVFTARGDLTAWQREVAAPCVGNPVLILSLCCALAGPLLARVGVNGGGVHLVGDSSSGKSLAQLIAASVWGDPAKFAASWDVSKGGVEIEAASRNDTVLILDEIKRADPRRVQEMAYAIANGVGKGTMTREREARHKLSWRLLALSSGERSLSEHAALSGNPAHAGAELRMVDVNAGTRKYRAFDNVHGMTGEQFHRTLSTAVARHYGHAGPTLVEAILAGEPRDDLPALFTELRERFEAESSQAGRVADRFALIALAGEYAAMKKLLPWRKGTALNACRLLFREWLESVGDGNAEDRQVLQAIADFIAAHGDSRFSSIRDLSDQPATVRDRAGYFEQASGSDKRVYLFYRAALIQAGGGYGLGRILRALEENGAIHVADNEGKQKRHQKKYRTPGGSGRFYVVDPDKLEAAAS